MRSFFNPYLLGILLFSLFVACEKDSVTQSDDLKTEVERTNQANFLTAEKMFAFLADQPTLAKSSLSEQFAAFAEHAIKTGIDFDFQQAIFVQQEANREGHTRYGAAALEKVAEVNDLLETSGFGQLTADKVYDYRVTLAKNREGLSEDEYLSVDSYAQTIEFLATSPSAARYYSLVTGSDGEGIEKNWWRCFKAQFAAAAASAGCVAATATTGPGGIFACGGAAIAWVNVTEACSPDSNEPTDPCANSIDPCCGVSCINGYICNYLTGLCVDDPDAPDPCDACDADQRCLNGTCVNM